MANPYIPPMDADFDAFFSNFKALIVANPTNYGLVVGDGTTLTTSWTAWHTAYLLATNPTTRTSPNIGAKDAQRSSAEGIIRPYAQQISKNSGIDPALILGLGLNLQNNTRPAIPPPTTNPSLTLVGQIVGQMTLSYKDTALGPTKRKPDGATGMDVWIAVGTVPAVAPEAGTYYQTWTKSPNTAVFVSGQAGKIATFFGRWTTRSGAGGTAYKGPWSDPLSVVVM